MRRQWNFALSLLIASVVSATSSAQVGDEELPNQPRAGRYTLPIRWEHFDRVAHVHIPKDYKPGRLLPVVVIFHDAGGDGVLMLDKNGWADRANMDGFIALAPTGLPALPLLGPNYRSNPRLWNTGQLLVRSPRAAIDDVSYVTQVLNVLQERVPFDTARLFATGHGNGATMAFRVGAELSPRFTAVAGVGGNPEAVSAQPSKPLPSLFVIGTSDPLQPLEGGEVELSWTSPVMPPVATSLESWAQRIQCATEAELVSDEDGLKWMRYPSLDEGPNLSVCYIQGQGHAWPGGKPTRHPWLMGPVNVRLDATKTIWQFFDGFNKPENIGPPQTASAVDEAAWLPAHAIR